MFYHVLKNHVPKMDPIILKKGQHVIVGEEDQQWKNWINCSTPDGCQQGWVPEQIITGVGTDSQVTEDYDATEMAVSAGDTVVSERELNQWLWCRNKESQYGWVPVENVTPFHLNIDEELELRLLKRKEAEIHYRLVDKNRDHLRQWLAWVDGTTSPETMVGFIENTLEQAEKNQGVQAGIWHHDELVGIIGHHHIDWNNRHTSIGYWLSQEHVGKGIMSRACEALINFSLRDLGLNRVEIRCAEQNKKSRAIPERLGFVREGLLREVEWLYDHYVDHVVYSKISNKGPINVANGNE